MRTFPLVVITFVLLTCCFAFPANAEEKIAKLQVGPDETTYGFPPAGVTNHCRNGSADCVFVVYTKSEVDEKFSADAKTIKALQDLVAELQKNVKALSDANDALTQRLQDAEKRFTTNR